MLSDFFNVVVDITAKHVEVERKKILSSCKNPEIVDARSIIVYILNKEGYYHSQIARMMNKTEVSIRNIFLNAEYRINNNKILKKILLDIQKEIATK